MPPEGHRVDNLRRLPLYCLQFGDGVLCRYRRRPPKGLYALALLVWFPLCLCKVIGLKARFVSSSDHFNGRIVSGGKKPANSPFRYREPPSGEPNFRKCGSSPVSGPMSASGAKQKFKPRNYLKRARLERGRRWSYGACLLDFSGTIFR